MDELLRALARKHRADPDDRITTHEYLAALERATGADTKSYNPLYDVWVATLIGLLGAHGVNNAVYDGLDKLTTVLYGELAANVLRSTVDAADGAFYLEATEDFDNLLRLVKYKCQHNPSVCKKHRRCSVAGCKCPGCYSYFESDLPSSELEVCWHHYQMYLSQPNMDYPL